MRFNLPQSNAGRRVGLLGGSFDPAHEGHVRISEQALKRFDLDQIWWLVSPQNPLKSTAGMESLTTRLAHARKIAAPYPFLRVLSPEAGLPQPSTYNTLTYLKKTMT